MQNILSIDLEDWFHPEYVRDHVEREEYQIEQSANRILSMLDEFGVKLTFFVVGEIAEDHPELIEKIYTAGHEISFHGFNHRLLWRQDANSFRSEVKRFTSLIKTITGEKCLGFRAPSCSVDNRSIWALDVLEEFGYLYDSSIVPMKTPLYGVLSAPIFPYHPSRNDVTKEEQTRKIIEFPLLVYPVGKLRIPAAGGFFLRLSPLSFIKTAIRRMNSHGKPAVLFFHPWEINPATPRLDLGVYHSFITYFLIDKTEQKLRNLLSTFRFTSFRNLLESKEFQ